MTATLPSKTGRDDQGARDAHWRSVVSAPQAANTDHERDETQPRFVGVGPIPPVDHVRDELHSPFVGGAPTPTTDYTRHDTQSGAASGGSQTPEQASPGPIPIRRASAQVQSPEPANATPTPKDQAPVRVQDSATDQRCLDTDRRAVGGAPNPVPALNDGLLDMAAAVVDDLEAVRISNENRLRQLTRNTEDKDGEERGFGLTLDHPDVARLAALVELLQDAEKKAENNLKYRMKKHPLGSWVKGAKGAGEKQVARLLASIGDPYWNDLHERPRLVSELWSYSGYGDSRRQVRKKGVKANWSGDAKKRAHLVAKKCMTQLQKPCYSVKGDDGLVSHTVHIEGECTCSRYRLLYDAQKSKYAGTVHPTECHGCTPKGKPPAEVGSPRKPAHVDAIAVRALAKEILRDMWHEARRLHEES